MAEKKIANYCVSSSAKRFLIDSSIAPLISLERQCELVGLPRSTYYYEPAAISQQNLNLMNKIDRIHLDHPYYGVRRMVVELGRNGLVVNHKRIYRLMALMGIETAFPKPRTTIGSSKQHRKFPYLLRNIAISQVHQVWSADITYVPLTHGFLYLYAIIDWFSRYIIGWDLSNTMTAQWCTEVTRKAIAYHGKPRIFNTDQGSQFSSDEFIELLAFSKIEQSMDGKGRAIDNVFIERFWRSIKQECIYLFAFEDGWATFESITKYMDFYNHQRPHQSLSYMTPIQVFGSDTN
jgi:putative transposase